MNKPMSKAWHERALKVTPLGTQTSSKAVCRWAHGFGPAFLRSGEGCRVVDVDGEVYVDWTMGLGAVIVGYADLAVVGAAAKGLIEGNLLSLSTECEVELAERLCAMVPGMDQVRFLKSGSDATTAAVRLARAHTGRDRIVRAGYHGWHDWMLNADYATCAGVPECTRALTTTVPFNDIEALEEQLLKGEVAAFILEPISLIRPYDWYMARVRDLCDYYGVVLIFDEVITGIRLAPGGAPAFFGVEADLVCMGKGLANGHSLSAVGGRRDIMQRFRDTHISGTYFGEMHALRASMVTLDRLIENNYWIWQREVGAKLIQAYEHCVIKYGMEGHTRILGMPHFSSIQWNDDAHFTLFQQEMMRRGILFGGNQFPALSHDGAAVELTTEAYDASMAVVSEAIRTEKVAEWLECQIDQPVFRRH